MLSLIPLNLDESDELEDISSISKYSSVIDNQHGNEFSFQAMPLLNGAITNVQVLETTISSTFNIHQLYTNPNKNQIKENKFNKKDAYVKVTVIKNTNGLENNVQKQYFINEQGLIDTKKNTDIQDIMIGRQEKFEFQGYFVYPNDIILAEQERLISRIHCKLICQNFFRKNPYINPLYKNTLNYLKSKLPLYILLKLEKFLEDPKECYVQDIGSVFGTHIRVDKQYKNMQIYQSFSIGTDTTFYISNYHVQYKRLKPFDENFDKLINFIQSNFFRCNLHGLPYECKSNESYTQIQLDKQLQEMELVQNQLKEYNIPFILLVFSGSGLQGRYLHYFFAKDNNVEFSIGRSQENNIRINSNTISRKQTRIRFNEKLNKWQIADGTQDRESANGTWVQLSTTKEREQKVESQPHPLQHLSEIKINDYILKVELIQAKKSKQNVDQQIQEISN